MFSVKYHKKYSLRRQLGCLLLPAALVVAPVSSADDRQAENGQQAGQEASAQEQAYRKLEKKVQALKLGVIAFNRDAVKYVAASKNKAAQAYERRQSAAYTFDFVMQDYQNKEYLKAINRYHTGRDLGVTMSKFESALKVANIYLDYGLHDYAHKLFNTLLGNEDSAVASSARYYLARYNYLNKYWDKALTGFESVRDGLPDDLMDEKRILHGIILQQRKQHKQAIEIFSQVPPESASYTYAQFNLAMSILRQGWWSDAESIVNRLVKSLNKKLDYEQASPRADKEKVFHYRSLLDRLHIAMGYSQLQRKYFREARASLEQVSGNGAYSYKAELGLGLVAAEQGRYDEALETMAGLVKSYSGFLVTEEANVVIPFLLESVESTETVVRFYERAIEHYTQAMNDVDKLVPDIEGGRYDHEYLANPNVEQSGYLNAQRRPVRGELNKYLFALMQRGRWQQLNRGFHDMHELEYLLSDWQSKLRQAGSYDKKQYRKLLKQVDKYREKATEVRKEAKDMMRMMVVAQMAQRRQYFASYFSQSKFALARVYDQALGSNMSLQIGDKVVSEVAVRQAYRDYLEVAAKDAINRRTALTRLAALELDFYDQIMADENNEQENAEVAETALDASITLMKTALADYPEHRKNDELLYQLIKAHDHKQDEQQSLLAMRRLVDNHPDSRFYTEVQFKLGEEYLTSNASIDAELAYSAALRQGNSGSVFYRRALYKRGWSRLKQSQYEDALEDFFEVLDLSDFRDDRKLSEVEQSLYDDVLRGISICFGSMGGLASINTYFKAKKDSKFVRAVYRKIGDIYLEQNRNSDAAAVFQAFVDNFSLSPYAPEFMLKVIEIWSASTYRDFEHDARKLLDQKFVLNGEFWQKNDIAKYENIRQALKNNMLYFTTYYHSGYQRSKSAQHLANAKYWYTRYFEFFPNDKGNGKTHFLYAELLSDARLHKEALVHYDKAAELEAGSGKKSEASYARLVTVDTLANDGQAKQGDEQWLQQKLEYTLRFVAEFPDDNRSPEALNHIVGLLFERKRYNKVIEVAARMPDSALKQQKQKAQIYMAHSLFQTQRYAEAEKLYGQLYGNIPDSLARENAIGERLASAIYKQAEAKQKDAQTEQAVELFLRVARTVPDSEVAPNAEYDAASLLIQAKAWKRAQKILERFRYSFPHHKLQSEVNKRLAVVYLEGQDKEKSAHEFARLASDTRQNAQTRREALWQAAELFEASNNVENAIEAYTTYANEFDQIFDQAQEARAKLIDLWGRQKHSEQAVQQQDYWRLAIIEADSKAADKSSERSMYLAATASLALAGKDLAAFERIRLTVPLKDSLLRKKKAMQRAISSFNKVNNYELAETSSHATFSIAQVYNTFSKAILHSPRPSGLGALELEQYDLLLQEQAYPFEEKAIEIFEANISLVQQGTYNQWIAKSYQNLANLVPSRYHRQERSLSFIDLPLPAVSVSTDRQATGKQ